VEQIKPIDIVCSKETRLALVQMSLLDIENTLTDIRSDIKEIKIIVNSQFKWLIGAIIGFNFLLLVAVAVKAFHLI